MAYRFCTRRYHPYRDRGYIEMPSLDHRMDPATDRSCRPYSSQRPCRSCNMNILPYALWLDRESSFRRRNRSLNDLQVLGRHPY